MNLNVKLSGNSDEHADMLNLQYKQHTFDAVIDKATLDCFYVIPQNNHKCGENSFENVQKLLSEVYRVLKPKGVFIAISGGAPDRRTTQLKHLDFDWEIRTETIVKLRQPGGDAETVTDDLAEPENHTIYICVKRGTDPFIEDSNSKDGQEGEQQKTNIG